jgi:hypothetical protein
MPMFYRDPLTQACESVLEDTYDCVDRIVLNAYFSLGHSAGGFRTWWRRLEGTDETLTNTKLMRMAGRLSRRVRAYGKANGIPIIDCRGKERKDEIAEQHLPKDKDYLGVFLIIVNRAPGVVWHIQRGEEGGISHIVKKRPQPYVNHYSFHIIDPEWGHIIIRMCGHPPFPAQVILNGHEYVARQGFKTNLKFQKEDNCFTKIDDAHRLPIIADTLCSKDTIGRLKQVCERWIYSACLCFALSLDEQERSGFRYQYSVYQAEYSRNLIFERGKTMEQIFDSIIDRTRRLLNMKTVRTIFGHKKRPSHRQAKNARYQVTVEKPAYNLTIFKVHYGKLSVKLYSKGERVLRIEVIAHNSKALRCGKILDSYPQIIAALKGILERFMTVLRSVDVSFIDSGVLKKWSLPSQVGAVRVGGIDVNRQRMQAVMQALIALAPMPRGFNASQLAENVRGILNIAPHQYTARQAAYDLKKFRGKQIVERIENSHRYQTTVPGVQRVTAFLTLHQKVLVPLVENAGRIPKKQNKYLDKVDLHCKNIQIEMKHIFNILNIAA